MPESEKKLFKRISEFLKYLAHESGKISYDRKCPFCGQNLTKERLKAFKVRIGRMQFLFRVYEEADSRKAFEFLHEFLTKPKGRDIPEGEDYPEWWGNLALELYKDEAKAKQE